MADLIDRQAAIETISYSIELCNKALDSMTLGGRDRYAVEVERNSLLKLKDDFKLLPSAEPEKIRCKDCKYKYVDGDNAKFNLCALNHNRAQSDDWYCADAEREESDG